MRACGTWQYVVGVLRCHLDPGLAYHDTGDECFYHNCSTLHCTTGRWSGLFQSW
jgi:hypothetical protein